jgi:uncharacterized protein YbjT (DUF2867 family)
LDTVPATSPASTDDGAAPPAAESGRIALVAGATGLVGAELCRQLRGDDTYAHVLVLARRQPPEAQPPLQVEVVDFARIGEWDPDVTLDTVFCALGTTIRKAGSEAAFRAVDFDLVVEMARLAKRAHAQHFVMVSALGADSTSRVFYLRVKGEAEEAVRSLGLPHVAVLRPSILEGERAEPRRGERAAKVVGKVLGPVMVGPLEKYRPTPAVRVAEAMRYVARPGREGFEVLDPVSIMRWRERGGLFA